MPDIEVCVEIYCSCGAGICNNASVSSKHSNRPAFTVEPCEKCLSNADDEGYKRGRSEGFEEAKAQYAE